MCRVFPKSPSMRVALTLAIGFAACVAAAPAESQVVVQETIKSVWVHDIPGPPSGDSWDSAIGGLFRGGGFRSIYPDIRTCVSQPNGRGVCAAVCPDAQTDREIGGDKTKINMSEQCVRSLNGARGLPLTPNDPRVRVFLYEVDPQGLDPQRTIATVLVDDPAKCKPDPCSYPQPRGAVVLSFDTTAIGISGTVTPTAPNAPTGAPGAAATGVSLWTQVTNGWGQVTTTVGQYWQNFTSLWPQLNPAEQLEAYCLAAPEWVDKICDYVGVPLATTTQHNLENRITCLRCELDKTSQRSVAEKACAQYQAGTGELENCLLRYFDVQPPACYQGATAQSASDGCNVQK